MAERDEYGIEKPPEGCTSSSASWTSRKLEEIDQDPNPWTRGAKTLGVGIAGSAGAIGGHFVDEISPYNPCMGKWHPPVAFATEVMEEGAQKEYAEKRAQAEYDQQRGGEQLDEDQRRFDEEQEMNLRHENGVGEDPSSTTVDPEVTDEDGNPTGYVTRDENGDPVSVPYE